MENVRLIVERGRWPFRLILAACWLAACAPTPLPDVAGYTLSHPPDVHISTGKSKASVYTTRIQFHVPGVEGYQGMLVRVEPNPAGAGVEQAVAAIYERLMGQAATGETTKAFEGLNVDGLAGVRMGEGGDFAVVVPYGNRIYIIAPVHDLATTSLDPQALPLFTQVLSTLRIQR